MSQFFGLGTYGDEKLYIRECGTLNDLQPLSDGQFGAKENMSLMQYWDMLNNLGSMTPIDYEAPLGIDPPDAAGADGVYVDFDIRFGDGHKQEDASETPYQKWGQTVQDTSTFLTNVEAALNDDPNLTGGPYNVIA